MPDIISIWRILVGLLTTTRSNMFSSLVGSSTICSRPQSSNYLLEATVIKQVRACSSRCCGLSCVVYHGWEGKCSEILATPSYSKNPRVNKDK